MISCYISKLQNNKITSLPLDHNVHSGACCWLRCGEDFGGEEPADHIDDPVGWKRLQKAGLCKKKDEG